MLVDGITVTSFTCITAGTDTMKVEDVPLTKGSYSSIPGRVANFPRDQCLVRTGVQRDEW
jgi:hypothetical protein